MMTIASECFDMPNLDIMMCEGDEIHVSRNITCAEKKSKLDFSDPPHSLKGGYDREFVSRSSVPSFAVC